MRENDFEKRVQQKMEKFDLQPSAALWTEVERRIREEKKRRFIFWWPLFFLLLAGGITTGIILSKKKNKKEEITQQRQQLPIQQAIKNDDRSTNEKMRSMEPVTDTVSAEIKNTNGSNPSPVETVKENETKTPVVKNKQVTPPIKIYTIKKEKKPEQPSIVKKNDPGKNILTNSKNKEKPIDEKDIMNDGKDDEPVFDKKEKDSYSTDPPVVTTTTHLDSTKTILLTDTVVKSKTVIVSGPATEEKKDSAVTNEQTKTTDKKKAKWGKGFTVAMGGSSIVNGLHLFHRTNNYNDALGAGPGVSPSARSTSATNAAFSWSAGLFIKKELSKKLEIKIGIDYQYLSAKMNVGLRKDSALVINGTSINYFYRPGATNQSTGYTNQFHFIGVSGELSWMIIRQKKFRLGWDNGLAFRQLISSNMLHYYSPLNFYYRNNDLLVKSYLFFTTGLSVPLSKKVELAPFGSFSITRLLKNKDEQSRNFMQYGIRIRVLLNKK